MKALYVLNPNITVSDQLLSKTFIPIILYNVIAYQQKVNLYSMTKEVGLLLFARVLCGVAANVLFTVTIDYISVTLVTIIVNTTPIFVTVFSHFILSENITIIEIIVIIFAFIGICIISLNKTDKDDKETYFIAVVFTFVSAVSMALGYTILRKINLIASSLYAPFYFFIGTLSFSISLMIYDSKYIPAVSTYSLLDVFVLILGALVATGLQTTLSLAYKYEKAARLQPYDYSQVIFSIIADLLIFNASFNIMQILGMAIVSV